MTTRRSHKAMFASAAALALALALEATYEAYNKVTNVT
jgi:hypothetical protein